MGWNIIKRLRRLIPSPCRLLDLFPLLMKTGSLWSCWSYCLVFSSVKDFPAASCFPASLHSLLSRVCLHRIGYILSTNAPFCLCGNLQWHMRWTFELARIKKVVYVCTRASQGHVCRRGSDRISVLLFEHPSCRFLCFQCPRSEKHVCLLFLLAYCSFWWPGKMKSHTRECLCLKGSDMTDIRIVRSRV